MLVEFTVGNFRSFRESVTLSMVAANISEKNKQLEQDNVIHSGDMRVLKSAAIYGANASGKSNLIAAFAFMRELVLKSTKTNSEEEIDVEPFLLNSANIDQPSHFEVTLQANGFRYRYGFDVSREKVHAEWLYRTKKRESELFWREGSSIEVKGGFKEGRNLENRTRENALFLSVADQWNGEIAHEIVSWFKRVGIISGIQDRAYMGFSLNMFNESEQMRESMREYMRKMDIGISDVASEQHQGVPKELVDIFEKAGDEIPKEIKDALSDENSWFTATVNMVRNKYDELGNLIGQIQFDFEEQESEGTKKAFALSGPILETLQKGEVLFVDELDARLHPLMTRYIIRLFNSTINNPKNAQLIFATHDTNLLNKQFFRRDQIWFAEKDRYGATDIYSLVEYKGVRNDASYESDYIAGKYGAIPYIGSISHLIEDEYDQA